jgi:hypothetical protein
MAHLCQLYCILPRAATESDNGMDVSRGDGIIVDITFRKDVTIPPNNFLMPFGASSSASLCKQFAVGLRISRLRPRRWTIGELRIS